MATIVTAIVTAIVAVGATQRLGARGVSDDRLTPGVRSRAVHEATPAGADSLLNRHHTMASGGGGDAPASAGCRTGLR